MKMDNVCVYVYTSIKAVGLVHPKFLKKFKNYYVIGQFPKNVKIFFINRHGKLSFIVFGLTSVFFTKSQGSMPD